MQGKFNTLPINQINPQDPLLENQGKHTHMLHLPLILMVIKSVMAGIGGKTGLSEIGESPHLFFLKSYL